MGGRTGLVPQMALKFCVRWAPEVSQIAEVLTGIARRTMALLSTIRLILDEIMFFIRFTFLSLAPITRRK